MNYPDIIKQHFFEPYHLGEWPASQDDVMIAKAGSYSLGALVQIQCLHEEEKIIQARFKAYGDPFLIAAASITTKWLEGQSFEAIENFHYQMLTDALSLPKPQQHCATIVADCIKLLIPM